MKIGPRTRIAMLLNHHPELESVLEWYRVRLDKVDYTLRLSDFCHRNDIDLDDLMVEFEAALDDDDDDYDDDEDDDDYDFDDEPADDLPDVDFEDGDDDEPEDDDNYAA